MRASTKGNKGIAVPRVFTTATTPVYDMFSWRNQDVELKGKEGGKSVTLFQQKAAEVPAGWSETAAKIVFTKYARGHVGSAERESSVRQIVGRVVGKIRAWGEKGGYFATAKDAQIFSDELSFLLLDQRLAFNSPVWFNLGVPGVPQQASACFINAIGDSMDSIMDTAKTEAVLFKGGSGSGINMSPLRSKKEKLSGTGYASGPLSFMRGFDAFAGAIKSGGKTRRAAKMVILNADHPDVMDFVRCKSTEQKRIRDLAAAGWDMSFDSEEMKGIFFQNANNSVRMRDAHMEAVRDNKNIEQIARTTSEVLDTIPARTLWDEIAAAAWECGDPGLQFHDTVNAWHTAPQLGVINGSNPCSEYMFIDDTACNLASLNLRKFFKIVRMPGMRGIQFLKDQYKAAVRIAITAMEIIVGFADYPTAKIAEMSKKVRTLGLGYANLGSLLMTLGLPYDSLEGRQMAGALSSLMSATAYHQSAIISRDCGGPFTGYEAEPMLRVIKKHKDAACEQKGFCGTGRWQSDRTDYYNAIFSVLHDIAGEGVHMWTRALIDGKRYGFRNAQATVLAPTGTISFMMDCETTGIEPGMGIQVFKELVGGGNLTITLDAVGPALGVLGYDDAQRAAIVEFIAQKGTVVDAPHLKAEHYPVFDCAFSCRGGRSLSVKAHIEMMAFCQPFISGAISKTVNLPREATVEDIKDAYMTAWRRGLKAIAIYRDGSKDQPVKTGAAAVEEDLRETVMERTSPVRAERVRMPDDVEGPRHKFAIAGHKGFIHVGLYPDGRLGEVFVRMAKEGSTVRGIMGALTKVMSIALQHGVPLEEITDQLIGDRYEPSGFTANQAIPRVTSITDYLGRWLRDKFQPKAEAQVLEGELVQPAKKEAAGEVTLDNPACHECGTIMKRTGTCHTCPNCGTNGGCS